MTEDRAEHRLIAKGEAVRHTVRYTRDEIAAFARMTHDRNPLHHDTRAAQLARFGEVIASGQQTGAIMMGVLATHFSRTDPGGLRREMLCLDLSLSFKHPVFAGQDVDIEWLVTAVEWNAKLGGTIGQLEGSARSPGGQVAVQAQSTVLVKRALA